MNAVIQKIISHALSHYRAEIMEGIKDHISKALTDFEERAKQTPNPIDDFVIDLAQHILNLEDEYHE